MVKKLGASLLTGQPDLVIHFFIAEEPSLSAYQTASAASCGRLGVFRAPLTTLQSASAVGHQQNSHNPLSRGS